MGTGNRMHDHHDLQELRELEAEAAADVERATENHRRIQQLLARREALSANEPRSRRRHLRRIVLLPAGLGAGVAAFKVWLVANRRTIVAAAAGAVAGTAAVTVLVVITRPASPRHHRHPASRPPSAALPPIGHRNPPHIGPPKGQPSRRPPIALPLPPTVTPPTPDTAPQTQPPTTPDPTPPGTPSPSPSDTKKCRINLPHLLRRGLLCGQMFE